MNQGHDLKTVKGTVLLVARHHRCDDEKIRSGGLRARSRERSRSVLSCYTHIGLHLQVFVICTRLFSLWPRAPLCTYIFCVTTHDACRSIFSHRLVRQKATAGSSLFIERRSR